MSTSNLARYRAVSFGTVGGVAYDAAAGRIYLTEATANRLHVVTVSGPGINPDDEATWTIATLAGDAAGTVGVAGFVNDSALDARFRGPTGLFFDDVDPDGADGPLDAPRILYIADTGNHVIRAVSIDLAGVAGTVTTVAGTAATRGYFGDGLDATDALLHQPSAITRCGNGDLFVADTGNNRVRRIDATSGIITTVLGDGVAASSGQGTPAYSFPVDAPLGLACDAVGNLFVSSTSVVRLLPAALDVGEAVGVVDGSGPVQTIYGAPPRETFPASITACLTSIAIVDDMTTWVTDACAGLLVELWRQPVAP